MLYLHVSSKLYSNDEGWVYDIPPLGIEVIFYNNYLFPLHYYISFFTFTFLINFILNFSTITKYQPNMYMGITFLGIIFPEMQNYTMKPTPPKFGILSLVQHTMLHHNQKTWWKTIHYEDLITFSRVMVKVCQSLNWLHIISFFLQTTHLTHFLKILFLLSQKPSEP